MHNGREVFFSWIASFCEVIFRKMQYKKTVILNFRPKFRTAHTTDN